MTSFKIIDGAFLQESYFLTNTKVVLKRDAQFSKAYDLRTDIQWIKEINKTNNQVSFAVRCNDGSEFQAIAESKDYKLIFDRFKGNDLKRKFLIGFTALVAYFLFNHFTSKDVETQITKKQTELSPEEAKIREMRKHNVEAWTYCQISVKENLKSPSTAKFQNYPDYIDVDIGTSVFSVKSYVDATNGFGATVRNNFICKIYYGGGGPESWKIIDIKILQK